MASTIPSPTATLHPTPSQSPPPSHKSHHRGQTESTTTPLSYISQLAGEQSGLVAVFDSAKLAGFPLPAPSARDGAKVWELQSRLGAGSSLVGFIASVQGNQSKPTTALISTPTLELLLPALNNLPVETTPANRLIIQLSVSLPPSDQPLAAPSPSLSQITALLPLLPESFAVVFSGSAQEAIKNADAIYKDEAFFHLNVLHVVEGVFAGRETVKLPAVAPKQLAAPIEAFTYTGYPAASKVIVLPSSYASETLRSLGLPPSVGVLSINVLGPWPTSTLLGSLPDNGKHVTEVVVIEEATEVGQGTAVLKELVIGAIFGQAGSSKGKIPKISSIAFKGGEVGRQRLLSALGINLLDPQDQVKAHVKQTLLLNEPSSLLPHLLAKTFLSSPSLQTRLSTLTSTVPSLAQSTLLLSPSGTPSTPFTATPAADSSALVVITSATALSQSRSSFDSLATSGSVLLCIPGWTAATVEENLAPRDRKFLSERSARVFVLPPADKDVSAEEQTALAFVGFFLLYAGGSPLKGPVRALVAAALGPLADLIDKAEAAFAEVQVESSTWGKLTQEEADVEEKRADLVLDGLSSFPTIPPSSAAASKPLKSTWHAPALHLLFKESFAPVASSPSSVVALAPSLEDKTYLATVTENRRLTPTTYDRNVFHLELSTAGTGLTYSVGEALGVHGWNDEAEVLDFLAWYGVDPSSVLSTRLPSGQVETRTVLQTFVQQVDIFGRPPKGFYAALVGKTKSREEARQLRFISAPEGAAWFKKWSEVETVTFVDVLKRFPGLKANLPIDELVGLVGDIKPRHYSISSAQKFVGDSVHLLVVTVEWDSPLGRPRFGQCTRYLAGLKVGQKVTVSIKPSVMKLPPLDTQPIIMAGLGTGAAPFRAFIQHRAWQKSQGIEVGPLIYYFGSRYSSQEYLYGEEIEAYLRGGVITHAGLAFSRDTRQKVYIQHKMLEDGALLAGHLTAPEEKDQAYFYLCGPTWPVPDVYEALVGGLMGAKEGVDRSRAEEMIEELKEREMYVLEVY